uniref:Potassium channel, subfamily K, member 4a n=1 Tax=Neolamprologus brichardi TaxID=32507 RepID=A0A3Q4FZ90_NEOBR
MLTAGQTLGNLRTLSWSTWRRPGPVDPKHEAPKSQSFFFRDGEKMRCTTLTTLLVGVMLYLVMGAFVFVTLEKPTETLAHEKLLETKKEFLMKNYCVTESDFHELVQGLMSAVKAGLNVSRVPANLTTRWDIASACFFCGTIITTIGFGNLSPRTTYGQLFCVCYALVGIPMFGILLAGVGDHMGTVLRRAVAKIETLFLKRKVRPTTVRVTSAVLSILIGCLIFLAVPTVVFQKVENWKFLESLYFVVITLTTVGFGDYVGGVDTQVYNSFFKLLVLLWIVFGLAYFASILTMIGNWLRVLSKRTRAEMEELRAHATDWTQNMSKDFRIPNPLEFNDPFLLQRRRWKRSERRRIRRGAQETFITHCYQTLSLYPVTVEFSFTFNVTKLFTLGSSTLLITNMQIRTCINKTLSGLTLKASQRPRVCFGV